MSEKISQQSHDEAMQMAKATQKPGQNKAQTKLIAAGIEKGIAVYKKQHKAKLREQDKQRKKLKRTQDKNVVMSESHDIESEHSDFFASKLPWGLLAISWLCFAAYVMTF